ncbi:hypothetical protein OGAPHI_000008 [Ogataea philodendri]|uniref:VPS10 domain-containing protein n=1 Tax=Ogataea philodendri TaxID=1378263 RepID=A0A9P8PGW0_9ASCO|nr:uncharacterized protein OGAPHI_000008 [Ogataea philodendri]KAH3671822.1 hypothetical protein OGAPHI_000008 [Ogataea philodendri]
MILLHFALHIFCLVSLATAADWKPKVSKTQHETIFDMFYFDDSPVMLSINEQKLLISPDNAETWKPVDLKLSSGEPANITSCVIVPSDNQLAFALTGEKTQFYTRDQGKTWQSLDVDHPGGPLSWGTVEVNYAKPDMILFSFVDCSEKDNFIYTCENHWLYSTDGLKSSPKKIPLENLEQCMFLKQNKAFTSGPDERVVCIQREKADSGLMQSPTRLVASSDFFKTVENNFGDVSNYQALNIEVEQSFLIVTVAHDQFSPDSEVSLYISKDGKTFDKAFFENQMKSWMFRVLPSTPSSLYLGIFDDMNSKHMEMTADLYKSDSTGLFFDKVYDGYLANGFGLSDFTKVQEIDGVYIILSHENRMDKNSEPLSKSKITFDDGKTWSFLKTSDQDGCNGDRDCSLNLVWTTMRSSDGNFETGPTPGIILGIGNTGKYTTKDLKDLKSYVSRDGGRTWKKVLDSACVFTFADLGNIIAAVPVDMTSFTSGHIDQKSLPKDLIYSLDQGESWGSVDLGINVFPLDLLTSKDGSTQHVVLLAEANSFSSFYSFAIDFTGAFEKTCDDSDYEDWYARVDPDTNEPICVFGHKEKFKRRKYDAKCFVNHSYQDLEKIEEPCACTIADTECTYGFIPGDDGKCAPVVPAVFSKYCKDNKGSTDITTRQLVPDNLCNTKDSFQIEKNDYTFECSQDMSNSTSVIRTTNTPFGEKIYNFFYLPSNEKSLPDETLLVLTKSNDLFLSYNGGIKFRKFLRGMVKPITAFSNTYFPDHFFVVTESNEIFYTEQRGDMFMSVRSPLDLQKLSNPRMTFNKHNSSDYIIYADSGCDSFFSSNCHSEAYLTRDKGQSFVQLPENVNTCSYVGSLMDDKEFAVNETLIVCSQLVDNGQHFRLISSTDYFASEPKVLFDKIIGFAETGKFLVAAKLNDDNSLTAVISVDGKSFAEAKFPADLQVTRQTAYTILDVNSEQIFLHVTTNSSPQREFGALLKSNYNGTEYVELLGNVNRNEFAFVDFESVQSLEGISIINTVSNAESVKEKGETKKIQSMVTYNDGAEWSLLVPPPVDSQGNKYGCNGKSLETCSLHLHSFTERNDPGRDTYSSASAVGLMFGVGNVGESLLPFESDQTATFFSADAGATWKEVRQGNYMWEFGDQGSILVLVKAGLTKVVSYSLDEGGTWQDFQFSDTEREVEDIATVPSDTARKFILIVKDGPDRDEIVSLDFSGIQSRQCKLEVNNDNELISFDDFEYWTPKHPFQSTSCLFGHESRYPRRKPSATDCFVGAAPMNKVYKKTKNCKCTRHDFECDYNFVLAKDGTCQLISGLSPINPKEYCSRDDTLTEYWEPTGYRKIPMSTCEQGLELDKWSSHPCPGKSKEYDRKHGVSSSGGVAFALTVAAVVFVATLAFVYYRGIRRNGGFSRFGEIRLDEDDEIQLIEENDVDRMVNRVVRAGIVVVSAALAFRHKVASVLKQGLFSRFRRGGLNNYERFSSFNDRIIDDEDASLFDVDANDDDAREIDSFLDEPVEDRE